MRKFLLSVLMASAAFGQHLSVGVIGGAPVTDLVSSETSARYTIGPTIQLLLPLGFAVEADALYRPLSFTTPGDFLRGRGSVSGSQWRFPILLQYRLPTPVLKPFVEAGPSFGRIGGIKEAVTTARSAGDLLHPSNAGFVMGAGLDLKLPVVRLTPGFRYTRQGSEAFRDISNQNQFEFLVGIRF